MNSDEFEKAFSDYLDGAGCETAQQAFFVCIRAAFAAGWQAALKQQD